MDDQKQQEERWRELAELLGVSDQPAPAPKSEPAPPPPVAKAESPAIKPYEEPAPFVDHEPRLEEEVPRPMLHEEDDTATILMPRDEPMADWETEFEEVDEDVPLDEAAPMPVGVEGSEEFAGEEPDESEELAGEQPAERGPGPAGEGGEEDQPERGRRRRRRGRRRGGPDKEGERQDTRPPTDKATPAPRPARDGDAGSRDQRGRRPGRNRDDDQPARKPPVPVQRQHDDLDEVEEDRPKPAAPRAAASDTDFSDWNVPSWQDLISSLYRPDR